jgi:hypothetical protein
LSHIRKEILDAFYTKTTRPDPEDPKKSYTDHTLSKATKFCCESFQNHNKKFPSWNYTTGKFTIIDSISYESTTQIPINYCPFCGKKIKYKKA